MNQPSSACTINLDLNSTIEEKDNSIDEDIDKLLDHIKNDYAMNLYVFRNKSTGRYTYLIGTQHSYNKSGTSDKLANKFIKHFKSVYSRQSTIQKIPYLATEKNVNLDLMLDPCTHDQIIHGVNNQFVKHCCFPAFGIDARNSSMDDDTNYFLNCIYDEIWELKTKLDYKPITKISDFKYYFDILAKYTKPKISKASSDNYKILMQRIQTTKPMYEKLYNTQKLISEYGNLEPIFIEMMDALLEFYYLDKIFDRTRSGLCIAGENHIRNIVNEICQNEEWNNVVKNDNGYITYENDEQFLAELSKYFKAELQETIEANKKINSNKHFRGIKIIKRMLEKANICLK
ncbi:MAG: hypothetical protein GY830_11275 [Bacteroidetes bacterium]|nr:hypothetical protein [Bacteroidota bacterium]